MNKTLIFLFNMVVVFFGFSQVAKAQKSIALNNELDVFTDNREYANSGNFSQTIFGARWAPSVVFNLDTVSSFHIGANLLHNFGSPKLVNDVSPTIYFRYNKDNVKFYAGAFPRSETLGQFPRAILKDTVNYFRPNIEGLWLQRGNARNHINVFIDWTSFQTATARENFLFGFNYRLSKDIFYSNGYASLLHNAGPAVPIPGDHVGDNGSSLFNAGVDLSKKTGFKQFSLDAGIYTSFIRTREVTGWVVHNGFLSNAALEYRNIYLYNAMYIGEGNNNQIWGDPFYNAKFYDRVDIGWNIFHTQNLEASVGLALHFVRGVMDNQQVFRLKYNFNNWIKKF